MIAGGMAIQAAGSWVVAAAVQTAAPVAWFAAGQALLGLGTAMVYPTLLAEAVGVYRLWRDLGYAVGALLSSVFSGRLTGVRSQGLAIGRSIQAYGALIVGFGAVLLVFLMGGIGLAFSLFPYVVMDRLTLWQAASARESLAVILIGVALTVPAIAGYTVFSYRVFRGKATSLSYG